MKTSELRKIVEEHGYTFQKAEDFICISYFGLEKMKLDLQNHSITLCVNTYLNTQSIKKIMDALIEYSLTPLNEREDEKAYYIKISDDILKFVNTNKIYVGFNYFALATSTVTQKQIDNFPAEIKGAIECGFLKKIEVEG